MDRIIAIYGTPAFAEQTRVHLGTHGVPTDRLDVVSLAHQGRVVDFPEKSPAEDLAAYFSVLLTENGEQPLVDAVVDSIRHGKAALVIHPRGKEEIAMIRETLESYTAETVLWRVAPDEEQGGLLGDHAAGFRL